MQDLAAGLAPTAEWLAPIATIVAAMMTASNLGARVTGWGFIVFVFASIGWTIVGIASSQTGLLTANAFLLVVNIVGVWRWLGREAKYRGGATAVAQESVDAPIPTLVATSALAGKPFQGADGTKLGEVVDAMLACDGHRVEALLVRTGGVGGIGERVHLIAGEYFDIRRDAVTTPLTAATLNEQPLVDADGTASEPLATSLA